jgi:phosphohistidine phosphatase
MPRLILLRHATAERAAHGQTDHDRHLTKGGRKESKSVGKTLAKRGEKIDLVLSSDSQRTRETWEGVTETYEGAPEVRYLYALFEAQNYVPIIKAEGGAAKTILVVGHNPSMHSTALTLAESLSGRDGDKLRAGFPKGALAILDFEGEWRSIAPGRMRLVAFIEADSD